MGNFSRPPLELLSESFLKDYVALHIEQGVPVLDRDLNLLADLLAERLRRIAERYIGSGIAGSQGDASFRIVPTQPPTNDFILSPGEGVAHCLVGGMELTLREPRRYSTQPGVPALTIPETARSDLVYLALSVVEVQSDTDETLSNPADVGMQTSVRYKVVWSVRVAEGASRAPAPAPGSFHHEVARIDRPANIAEINPGMLTDLRQTGLSVALLERRVRQLEALLAPAFAPPPDQFAPKSGQQHRHSVTLFGRNFDKGTPIVRFGGVEARVIRFSYTEILISVPRDAPLGAIKISVTNGSGTTVSEEDFTVEEYVQED